jgi:hypothetical protein
LAGERERVRLVPALPSCTIARPPTLSACLTSRLGGLSSRLMGSQVPDTLLRLVERESIERTIAATDKQIDALVYELYGLTEEEVRIVEGEAK